MHIVVLVKQIPDPDAPASAIQVNEDQRGFRVATTVKSLISPFDEQALEAALRIRDAAGPAGASVKITAMSLGRESAREVLKHALAMGADDAVLLCDGAFDGGDSFTTALALSKAMAKLEPFDLIIAGRQAADFDFGLVGVGLAELLGLPAITMAKSVEVDGRTVRVERALAEGFEMVESDLPVLVTVSNELGSPRYPSLRQMMRAGRKPIAVWTAADLGLPADSVGAAAARTDIERFIRPRFDVQCDFINGDSAQEIAATLLARLRDARIL
ncbi:MAG TPA: electron transfer flavoprotein subunit beta/FixA family protein [Candidatus Binataceae bacterium]|nr:electron transfer flavoprotein subunit beta/FixA family protein [Candidatus Binataceae bacterium]